MFIQSSIVSIMYNKIDNIKKIYYDNSDLLKSFFNEATVLPVPDDAPVEIPRIILKTLHEHSKLSITPVISTFEVQYNNGYGFLHIIFSFDESLFIFLSKISFIDFKDLLT